MCTSLRHSVCECGSLLLLTCVMGFSSVRRKKTVIIMHLRTFAHTCAHFRASQCVSVYVCMTLVCVSSFNSVILQFYHHQRDTSVQMFWKNCQNPIINAINMHPHALLSRFLCQILKSNFFHIAI